jgi:hypothetical protein
VKTEAGRLFKYDDDWVVEVDTAQVIVFINRLFARYQFFMAQGDTFPITTDSMLQVPKKLSGLPLKWNYTVRIAVSPKSDGSQCGRPKLCYSSPEESETAGTVPRMSWLQTTCVCPRTYEAFLKHSPEVRKVHRSTANCCSGKHHASTPHTTHHSSATIKIIASTIHAYLTKKDETQRTSRFNFSPPYDSSKKKKGKKEHWPLVSPLLKIEADVHKGCIKSGFLNPNQGSSMLIQTRHGILVIEI